MPSEDTGSDGSSNAQLISSDVITCNTYTYIYFIEMFTYYVMADTGTVEYDGETIKHDE
jgi:hypothetical protein